VWLINTGWTGGAFGEGRRMPIAATRTLVEEALSGRLEDAEFRIDEVFGFEVPVSVHGIDDILLRPRDTWRDPEAYDRKARELARMFRDNFEQKFADAASEVAAAGPRV
jgi:phosphoenolpyruvate carboxykinase (ATP)